MTKIPNTNSSSLPYIIAISGLVLSILAWYGLTHTHLPEHLLDSLIDSLPWIILIGGTLAAALVSLVIRIVQLTHERKRSLDLVNENFQKEIAERLRTEETKQKLEKALLQGQKLQAIGTLAGGIAHDFNNLLYAIIGYVEMARDDVEKNSIVYQNLGKVIEASHRGQELVSRILTFSRRQHLEFKPICIKDTIEGVLSLLRPTIPASVTIDAGPIKENCFILGNQTQLHQVLVNIINNAVDAMDGEGTIIITVSHLSAHDAYLRQFPKLLESNCCKIDISDTGHGMDANTVSRIFEPFYTTKEVGKGTGLGLSTVHAIIEEHKGEISVHSQLGHGTTFTLLIPELSEGENNGQDTTC